MFSLPIEKCQAIEFTLEGGIRPQWGKENQRLGGKEEKKYEKDPVRSKMLISEKEEKRLRCYRYGLNQQKN